ncbi:Oar protein [Acidisarcina polymorpha]|uniref:Oar protein n=1 Tax=Acidisarcina polymorpha TaxID=2211140 RepID=A0A2Z5G222_9BACT|nr:carboxypeptidase regulatory-like domain-containing protein [Acidisarcina polymorpha]AXC12626.1 Oar protein [Acidisarcina polymorpha]
MQSRPLLVALVLSAALHIHAQSVTGAIRGMIEDPTSARVANATIDLRRADSSLVRHVTAEANGEFRVQGLQPGAWQLSINAPGFATASSDVNVLVSSTQVVTVTMRLVSVLQSAGVSATASSITTQRIDADSNVHQSIITSADLQALPLPARSFANIAYLAPGTEPVEPSDPTKARITAVSTGGSSGLNNELSVDGADDSDDYIGGFLQNISPDAIAGFAIRTAQEDADSGNTTAGSVVITTKSGNNQFHGGAAFYERAADLNARYPIENPAPNPKQPFSRQNYVGTLGGPVVRDKLWFFSAFEHVHENASIAYSPGSTTQFDALATLAADGLIPGVPFIAVPTFVPIPFRDYFGSGRFDYTQSQRSSWYLRGTVDRYTTHNNLVQQGTLPSTGLRSRNNYLSMVVANEFVFSSNLLGSLVVAGVGLRLTQARNSDLGFALAFPFSSTSQTISGFETYGDNQFATPITYFPSIRNQEKYQLRYDLSYTRARHALKFGVNFIHEPVLGGAFPNKPETLYTFPENPTYYLANPAQFAVDYAAGASTSGVDGGSFSQDVQRLALYAQDSWHVRNLTFNYGLHYSTTFGLFEASGRPQTENPGYLTLQSLGIPLVRGAPHDDHAQIAPRFGFTYAPRGSQSTVIRAGFGLYFDDLAQNGWATAFQAVNTLPAPCADPIQNQGSPGCIPGDSAGGVANLIDPRYRTPYAVHVSAGVQHNLNANWSMTSDFIHEQGNHGYRAYNYTGGTSLFTPQLAPDDPNQATYVPDVNVYHSDNRSSYNGLLLHLQGAIGHRANFIANYSFSKAQTWGCVLGELFDYVNGVCNPLNPFGPGDYGPSGEDVRHRFVLAGTLKAPAGFEISGLSQAESARPFTITTPDNTQRITVNNQPTSLDQFRATPYIQTDLRVSRPIAFSRWPESAKVMPFIEMFNLFNRNNPGANYVTNAASIPNCTVIAPNSANCTATNLKQLGIPAGALGDFFGPGTTVGIPFAAQLGVRLTF